MKFYKILILILSFPLCSTAQTAPETIYIEPTDLMQADDKEPRVFVTSNSIHEGLIRVVYSGQDLLEAKLYCDGSLKEIVLLQEYREPQIRIPKNNSSCILKIENMKEIHFVNTEVYSKIYKKFTNYQEACLYDEAKFFFTNEYPHMTCTKSADDIKILSDSKESFLIKLETLLGYKPSLDFINNQNPYADIDFSKAPVLDAIYVSTLLYQNDFSGQVLSRILKFHAARGTLVNIIGTGYMHSEKAKKLLKEMSRFSPNISIQEYKYYEHRFFRKFNFLTNYLRDMHVKLLVTLSESSPKNNVLIIGGRNVHDGFLFEEKPDLSNFPELDQVAPEANFAYWQDVEIKIVSKPLAETAYAHLLKFWNRNLETMEIQPISSNNSKKNNFTGTKSSKHKIRHILSAPFSDNQSLERLFVEMIDSANSKIMISSPYLRPTEAIFNAILRAIARGVRISIQTRIDLKGDTLNWLYEETNKAAINDLYDKVEIFEWQENSILHSKLLLVDNELSFVGSVNLSRRSFIQDVESGMLIKSESFNSELRSLIESYQAKSRVINEAQERKFWASIMVYLFQDQF